MPRKPNNRKATCHPERPHYAKGLCATCYRRTRPWYKIAKKDDFLKHKAKRLAKINEWKKAHPDSVAKTTRRWSKFLKRYKRMVCGYCGERFWLEKSAWRWRKRTRKTESGRFYCCVSHKNIMEKRKTET